MPPLPLPRPTAPDAGSIDQARRRAVASVGTATGAARSAGRFVRSRATPQTLLGAAVESAWLSTHLLTYPVGMLHGAGGQRSHGYRVEHLPPLQRGLVVSDVEAAGTPILLVHGLIDNRSIFTLLRLGLTRRGFGAVFAMNYSVFTTDVRTAARQLGEEVEAIIAETGFERIHVVGHSLGGLVARYYVTRLGGDARVHTLVTLGTPHEGTWAAYALPTPLTRALRPGSGLVEELGEPVPRCRTRFVAYWSDADQLVVPQRGGALRHRDLSVRNIRLHGVGHASLPIVGSVVHGISSALAHLDHDGSTLAPGAIALTSTSGAALRADRSSGRRARPSARSR